MWASPRTAPSDTLTISPVFLKESLPKHETVSQIFNPNLTSSTTTFNRTSGPSFEVDGSSFVAEFIKFVRFSSGH